MTDCEHDGCQEYRELSRREFLSWSAGTALLATAMPPWLPKVVLAQSANTSRDVIISIFMRGGADGLSLCAPFADANYYTGRPTIAIPRPDSTVATRGIALDNMFAFPRAMATLVPAFTAGELLVVHGAGSLDTTRSHFDAQRFIEVGKPRDPTLVTGWLARHLSSVTPRQSGAPLRAIGLATGLPQTLVGAPKTLPIPNPANFGLAGNAATRQERTDWLKADYAEQADPVRAEALDAISTIDLLRRINFPGYAPANGAVYPNTSFGNSLRSAAALIKADIGVEAIQVDIGGWDTHANEDPLAGGMFTLMQQFAGALSALHADVVSGNQASSVTVVAISEFGRNVRENGSRGTDHGRAGCMFVIGKRIAGGKVMTNNWQPLARENLESGQDVRVTIDHRDILSEIVRNRLANTNTSYVFPDFAATTRGATK
ncbi:MAG: DUF1501 domain-containing protein [Gemmatimonadaceae bacterium]|nr:DUF1501 domain-containing protein [Gemmatimonadaceae bacterium]